MIDPLVLVAMIVVVALVFDFVNGFHDASNSIATIVATKVLTPRQAVAWAAFFNFVAVFVFGTGVAKTVGSGMIDLSMVTPVVILSGLLGAIAWGLLTWWFGLPSSSSHALMGGYAGAVMANYAVLHGVEAFARPLLVSGWTKILLFIVVAPVMGIGLAHILMRMTLALQKKFPAQASDKLLSGLQLFSSAFLSLMHGGNDAQKTAGIITGALVASGVLTEFQVPTWVLFASYGVISLGTFVGGWRIVHTLGQSLTRLRPNGGFCAETSAALSILLATWLKMPVSTTHVTTGSILGVGSARRMSAVRWGTAGRIVMAWVLTMPAAALMGCVFVLALARFAPQ